MRAIFDFSPFLQKIGTVHFRFADLQRQIGTVHFHFASLQRQIGTVHFRFADLQRQIGTGQRNKKSSIIQSLSILFINCLIVALNKLLPLG